MKLRPAHYTLAGSAAYLALSVISPTLRQWERVQQVALGVFALSALTLTCAPRRSKEKTISDLAAIRQGSLDNLSKFAYDNKEQFEKDWPRDKPEGTELEGYTHYKLIKKFFHQGLGNSVMKDLRKRVDIDLWDLQLGIAGDSEFKIEEYGNTLKIIYTGTLQLLDGLIKSPLSKLTSTLTVDVKEKRAISFVYTLEPLDGIE